jgi:phosphatidylglycerophosphatase A
LNDSSPIEERPLTAIDRFAYAIATGLGAGFLPKAPGTFGALEGVVLALAIKSFHLEQIPLIILLALMNIALFFGGVWAATVTCRITRLLDPGIVVIDEVSGQLISLTPYLLAPESSLSMLIVGFVLFRVFDILKPYPIRNLESLQGGLGVMADDALAGVYAAALLWLGHIARLL